jgi:tryptophan 2,3-dioxygenase
MDYASYLKLTQLLALQVPMTDYEREELIFITAHQSMELWFKVLLVEIKKLYGLFLDTTSRITLLLEGLNNCCLYWTVLITQFKGIKALSPMDFAKFRKILQGASGSQSEQYKAIERYLGISFESSSCNLREAVFNFLYQQERFVSSSKQNYLLNLYKKSHDHAMLIDKLLEFDECCERWRVEHLRLVKRMIGRKIGTGYSSAEKLSLQIDRYAFRELWELKDYL